MKFINILKCRLHFNAICFPFKINRLMKRLFFLIQISDKPDDSLRFMIFDMLGLISSFIFEYYRQFRVKICCFMQPAFYFLRPELRLFKNRIIRQKINCCSCLFCLSDLRKKSVFQFNDRNSALISVMVYRPITADLNIHICRKCIYNRRTDAMKTSACLIRRIVKFSPCMKCGKHKPCRRNSFLMHINRNSPPVIGYCCRSVFF